MSNWPGSRFFLRTWMSRIWRRSSRSGRSQKKISSNRPLRSSSGGSWWTLFAVAITNTGVVFSWSHVMNEANTREVVPPSVCPDDAVPENPFSSSSIHRIAGAIASDVLITERMFSSDEPTSPPKILPTSRRRSGICHSAPTAFAVSDLPVPGTPIRRMPFGSGSPKSRARELNALRRFTSQSFRMSIPPTSLNSSRCS
jgi:hypothetical protein